MRTIEINLLPPEYAPENPYSIRNIAFLVLSLFILIFLALDVHQVIEREKSLDRRNQNMLHMLENFRQVKDNIEILRRQTTLLHERRNLLEAVVNRRTTWSDKLSQIYAQIPVDVWLSQISLERQKIIPSPEKKVQDESHAMNGEQSQKVGEQIVLYILGDARDLSRITEFISRLEAISCLENTQFHTIDQRKETGRSVMSFEITAKVNVEGDNL